MIDNGILLLQCVITKILMKEETQQVRHYLVCSKYENTEEDKGCTEKNCVFLQAQEAYLRGRWVSNKTNKVVGCDWPLVVPLYCNSPVQIHICAFTFGSGHSCCNKYNLI